MSTVVKDLGAVSAYAYAVEKGYTGTEAEFAELMADYADVGQRAEGAANSALESKTAAQTAATTATNKASEATTAAQTATTKAGEATTAAGTATTAKNDAVAAKTAAETAQGKAEDAQAAVESVAESIPSDYSQLSEDVSDLKGDLTRLKNGTVLLEPYATITGANISSNGIISPINKATKVYVYAIEADKTYTVKQDGATTVLCTLSNTYYSGTTLYASPKTADGDTITFANAEGYAYLYVQVITWQLVEYAVSCTTSFFGDVEESINDVALDVAHLKTLDGSFETVSLTETPGSIYAVASTSSNNGVIKSSTSSTYAVVSVNAGERYRITGMARANLPIVVYYNSAVYLKNATYRGALEFVTVNKVYTDYQFDIPSGVTAIGINIVDSTNHPVTLRKFTSTSTIEYLYDLNVNSFAHNPVDFIGKQIALFNKIVCIGDSLTAGGKDTPSVTPNDAYISRETTSAMYSYPTFIKKMFGVDTVNMGLSGYTSAEWYTANENTDFGEYDAAIMLMGNNDQRLVETLDSSTLATAQALHKQAIDNIIAKLRADSHGIRIFICTLLPGWDKGNILSPYILSYARSLAEDNDDIFLVDLSEYSQIEFQTSAYSTGHCTGIGYQKLANEIASIINYTIDNDPDSFKWVPFIGTRYATLFDE